MAAPCRYCEKKGCGAYHDVCPAYQEYIKANNEIKQESLMRKEARDLSYRDLAYRRHCFLTK